MSTCTTNLFPPSLYAAIGGLFSTPVSLPVLLPLSDASCSPGLEPTTSNMSGSLLHADEIATAKEYKLQKRKTEYLTGRLCGKMALANYLGSAWGKRDPVDMCNIAILNRDKGRPLIEGPLPPGIPRPDISISHGREYAAALVSPWPCGIDLQRQEKTLLRVKEKYCLPHEDALIQKMFASRSPTEGLVLLWTAKEAAQKALSFWAMPGFLDLAASEITRVAFNSVALTFTNNHQQQAPDSVTVAAALFKNYGLAVCIIAKGN